MSIARHIALQPIPRENYRPTMAWWEKHQRLAFAANIRISFDPGKISGNITWRVPAAKKSNPGICHKFRFQVAYSPNISQRFHSIPHGTK